MMDNLWKKLSKFEPYYLGIIIYLSRLSGIDGKYCYVSCDHGCCGSSCCYNMTSLALGLIFGLLSLLLVSSGFAICFVQYWLKRKKTTTTREASTQYELSPSVNPMKPSSIPPNLINDFKQKKKTAETKKVEEAKQIDDTEKADKAKTSDDVSVPVEETKET